MKKEVLGRGLEALLSTDLKESVSETERIKELDQKELELDRARKDAAELSEARRINRILVDNREVTSFFNMTEHFVFNASHAEVLPGNIKIGIVFSEETFDYNKYVEDVAITSGTNLRAFLDERKAKEWLLEDG